MANSYTVTAFTGLTLPPQTLVKLSAKQLKLRAHQVKAGAGGFHVSDHELSFKCGEVVKLKDTLPKTLGDLVESDEPDLLDRADG